MAHFHNVNTAMSNIIIRCVKIISYKMVTQHLTVLPLTTATSAGVGIHYLLLANTTRGGRRLRSLIGNINNDTLITLY